ncbi:hypothetical protein HPP92_018837 [Vanilla planifolia]|uniref:ABC transporter domain-containing protein n=1 Tax=Vanilla planifolia TaxID=51239 RepID=A0A835Q958_VANPL|nr:hypothetical protein HPP92_018837 [Vanilla planifolia]
MPTISIFLEYGAAVAASTYCLTFFFNDHSIAQNVVLLVHFLGGLILMVISFVMGVVNATKNANSFLKNFFRISPAFCFADGLASLALRRQDLKIRSKHGILDWNVTGASLCYLAVESAVYFLLTIAVEYIPRPKINLIAGPNWSSFGFANHKKTQTCSQPLLGSLGDSSMVIADEDVDVTAERHRTLNNLVDNAIVCLHNLRKVYPAGNNCDEKVAVHSLTFTVQEGECFGFLGTNGAGKTTTLSMLIGFFGSNKNKEAQRSSGSRVKEHLLMFAVLKGVDRHCLESKVTEMVNEVGLADKVNSVVGTLSGGMKRKLSVGIALIGNSKVIILDEPTSGMDPYAMRSTWQLIKKIKKEE